MNFPIIHFIAVFMLLSGCNQGSQHTEDTDTTDTTTLQGDGTFSDADIIPGSDSDGSNTDTSTDPDGGDDDFTGDSNLPTDQYQTDQSSGDNDPIACDPETKPTPNEGLQEPAGLDGCPSGMAKVADSTTCMDQWEAHLYTIDGSSNIQSLSPYHQPTGVYYARSSPDAVPQGYISEIQAQQACINSGKRLCSPAEWLMACEDQQGYTYPYGNTRIDGYCNDLRTNHPVIEYFGTDETWIWTELDNACINQQENTVAKTGAFANCHTSDMIYDLVGNLNEWVADAAGEYRGGFYYESTTINGPGCFYRVTAHTVSHYDYSTGFRCCYTLP